MISIKSKGMNKAKSKGQKAFKAMDLERVNKAASIFLDSWVQRNFKTDGGNVGGWEPFLYGGRMEKGGINTSAKLLQDTGALRKSFRPFYDRKSAGIGSKLPYAIDHQEGKDNTPQRRLLPEDNEVQSELKRLYGKHVRTALRA